MIQPYFGLLHDAEFEKDEYLIFPTPIISFTMQGLSFSIGWLKWGAAIVWRWSPRHG